MTMMKLMLAAALLGSPACASPAANPPAAPAAPQAAAQWDPAARTAAQREAMAALSFLDGQWRGGGHMGEHGFIQTERVGSLLDGTVKLIEGRAYDSSGKTAFNAFAVISYDPAKRAFSMRSYAMGFAGDFPLEVRPDGFSWAQPMGPGASLRYTATVKNGIWHEVGDRIAGDAPPVRIFEIKVRRIGDAAWPAGGAVPMR